MLEIQRIKIVVNMCMIVIVREIEKRSIREVIKYVFDNFLEC